MMSRPAAGVRNKSVIVTLPGSPKGAKENLQAIIKTLPHACLQASGANSRALHAGGVKKLEADAGIGREVSKAQDQSSDLNQNQIVNHNENQDHGQKQSHQDQDQSHDHVHVQGQSQNQNNQNRELDHSKNNENENQDQSQGQDHQDQNQSHDPAQNQNENYKESQEQINDHNQNGNQDQTQNANLDQDQNQNYQDQDQSKDLDQSQNDDQDQAQDQEQEQGDKQDQDHQDQAHDHDLNQSQSQNENKDEGQDLNQDLQDQKQNNGDQHHPHGHNHGHNHNHGNGHGNGHGNLVRFTRPDSAHLSNDPQLGPSRRNRESPYPMVSVDDALAMIEEHTPEPQPETVKVNESIIGFVLAEDVRARESVPAFRASIVDGYAVVVPQDGNVKGVFPVTGVSHAAPGQIGSLQDGEIARITTGAPLPPGATAVIMVEDTVLQTMTEDDKEEKEVEIQAEGVKEGSNVREVGSDIQEGSVILNRGEQISGVGGEIGLLAAVGVAEAKVYRKPIIGILSTGDEIVEYNREESLKLGEVRDTNRITLISAAKSWGFEVVDLGIAKDQPGTLEETLRQGLRQADVLITTGGVSMGELDLLKPTIERSLGGTIHFGRVAMKPGKPSTFATVSVKDNSGNRVSKPIFSLPGNPASALVTFHLFVLPSIHKLSGVSPPGLPKVPVVLAHDFPLDSRPEYHRAVVTVGKDGLLTANSTGGQRSSKVGSLRSANALLCLPGGKGTAEEGSRVDALLMDMTRES